MHCHLGETTKEDRQSYKRNRTRI